MNPSNAPKARAAAGPRGFRFQSALVLAAGLFFPAAASAQPPPLVYDVENTGAAFPPPPLPTIDQLPYIPRLPDPFKWADGSGRDTSFASWGHHRADILAQIQNYEIGRKPARDELTVTAVYANGQLTVNVLRNSNLRSLTLNSRIALPAGSGPFPAVIGMALAPSNGSTGSLPASIFAGAATIDYVHNEVTEYAAGQQVSHAGDPYFFLYPEYSVPGNVGQYSAWAWGVSRLIDGLEIAVAQKPPLTPLPIDLKHLCVTGCSYAGKMALFAGAFDERVALTIAQESGGGGAPAWRVSQDIEPSGSVEKIDNTDGSWFMQGMKTTFAGDKVHKLPEDHHELMALVAPRALLVTGNTDFTWLSNRSCYVSARAALETYRILGIEDRFGFYIDGGHGHCAVPAAEIPSLQAFVDKFLFGRFADSNVRTFPQTTPFTSIDYAPWMPWAWKPVLTLPSDIRLEATGPDGAVATYAVTATDVIDGDVPVSVSPPSGSTFPLGTSTVTATATNAAGNTVTGAFSVIVADTTAPVFTSLTASPDTLSPPNHDMRPVTITAAIADLVDPAPVARIVAVTSNEPDTGTGEGDTALDSQITGALTVNLRAERAGSGSGRIYTITVEARDVNGNTRLGTVTVSVPH